MITEVREFQIDLQLFGGGGSSSGLGGGKSGRGSDNNGEGFYFFHFLGPNNKEKYRFIHGKDRNEAIKEANKWGKQNGMKPSDPLTGPLTKDEAKKKLEGRGKSGKK